MPALEPGAGGEETFFPDYDYASDFFYPGISRPSSITVGNVLSVVDSISMGQSTQVNNFFPAVLASGVVPYQVGFPEWIDTESSSSEENPGNGAVVFEDWPQANEAAPLPPIRNPDREPMSDADWNRVYDEYVILNPSEEMPVDWGDVFGGIVTQAATNWLAPEQPMGFVQTQGGGFGGAGATGGGTPPPTGGGNGGGCCPTPGSGGPKYGRFCYATGTVTPIRRKRRKALLTNGDFNDLMRIASLPNKETVKIALASAIR